MNYYGIMILVLFISYNIVLESLKINGLLYQGIMFIFIILNTFILITFRKYIKRKSLIIIMCFLIQIFSKDLLQLLFVFSNMMILMTIGFSESKSIKIISILIITFFILLHVPLFFMFLLVFGTDLNEERGRNDIYEDMHYYCDNHYEVYSYSAGAMDHFHYSIGKYYDILMIDDIIHISYNERNETTKQEYETYLKKHNCSLVGDKHGSK